MYCVYSLGFPWQGDSYMYTHNMFLLEIHVRYLSRHSACFQLFNTSNEKEFTVNMRLIQSLKELMFSHLQRLALSSQLQISWLADP